MSRRTSLQLHADVLSFSRSQTEPLRTESVIKAVTDKQENARKSSDPDKRMKTDTQNSNISLRYPDKPTSHELGNSVEGKKGLGLRNSFRDMQLRDVQNTEDVNRRDKQSIADDFDRSRDFSTKAKPYEFLMGLNPLGVKRPNNGMTSRSPENGAMSLSSYSNSFMPTEERSSLFPANEPPTLVPYHSAPSMRTSVGTSHSSVPSTMPKLTPIAPRISNGSPLTVSYSSESEHRESPSFGMRKQTYPNTINAASSAPSVTVHSSIKPWTASYVNKSHENKVEENSRTKQSYREERDLDKTGGFDHATKQQLAKNAYPLSSWERASYNTLPHQLRAMGAERVFVPKDEEEANSRELTRDSSNEGPLLPEQIQMKVSKSNHKQGCGSGSLRKETSDHTNAKISRSSSPDEYQRNQPYAGRNERSVVAEYVNYNRNDDGKGSLGNVLVHGKEVSYRLSVERREGKYLKPELSKNSRAEESRVTSYSNCEGQEPEESSYVGLSRAEVRSTREDHNKESIDRARPLEPSRVKEQAMYKESGGRKLDSREHASFNDGKKNNDRNNNSASLAAPPFLKLGVSNFPSAAHGEETRFAERGAADNDKVFVPPNATLDMYERREMEIEKNAFKKTEFNSFPRKVEDSHFSNEDVSRRVEERRNMPRRDDVPTKVLSGRFENDKRSGGDTEEVSSDENDDRPRRIAGEPISPEKLAQLRVHQPSNRTAISPPSGAVRQRRLSSPLPEQRSENSEKRNAGQSNAYAASYGASFQNRRLPSDNAGGHSRESGAESGLDGLKSSSATPFMRMEGSAFPSPYFGQLLTPQGLSEAPLLVLDPASIYGAMYRPHVLEQGMFPSGTFTADPMTGQIMMIPPEAYIPMGKQLQWFRTFFIGRRVFIVLRRLEQA